MSKKATLAEIIAKKKQGNMDIEIRKISLPQYMDLIDELEESNGIEGMNKLIYECCPMFKENANEAMEVYEVSAPTDLPSAVLEDQLNEINGIIEIINSFYGADKLEDDIKNS